LRAWTQTPGQPISAGRLAKLDQGQEPVASRDQPRQGGVFVNVLIYVNTRKEVGDVDHLKVFANRDAADTWFEENDPEGVAFEYEVLE
jgi:hypothetical protein